MRTDEILDNLVDELDAADDALYVFHERVTDFQIEIDVEIEGKRQPFAFEQSKTVSLSINELTNDEFGQLYLQRIRKDVNELRMLRKMDQLINALAETPTPSHDQLTLDAALTRFKVLEAIAYSPESQMPNNAVIADLLRTVMASPEAPTDAGLRALIDNVQALVSFQPVAVPEPEKEEAPAATPPASSAPVATATSTFERPKEPRPI